MEYQVKSKRTKPKTVKPIVLIVRTRDNEGRPKMLETLYEEETIDVSNELNREFLIVFGEPSLWEPNKAKREGNA